MTVTAPLTGPDADHHHLGVVLAPIEAVMLDRVTFDWEAEFYEAVVDPMTPWYPDDEAGETPLAQFTDQVRERAKRAALEACVASVCDSLRDVPDNIGDRQSADGREMVQLRTDLALLAIGE